MSKRVAVLVSGRGSNMVSLLEHQRDGGFDEAEIVLVVSNKASAPALEKAAGFGVQTAVLSHRGFPSREAYDHDLVALLREHRIDIVCLAGFMRILSPVMVEAFPRALVNIHPSLLPAFPGLDVQQQALDYGVKFAGCTVHFVDTGVDTGPIIAQAVVPVHDDDTADSLAARILEQEHRLYPEALKAITEKPFAVEGRRVVFSGQRSG